MQPVLTAISETSAPRPRRLTRPRLLALAFAACALVVAQPARAQLLYWDANGATTGAGGPTPTGTWGTDDFWSMHPLGELLTGPWAVGSTAVFAAGSDATGTYTVTLSSPQIADDLNVQEGNVTFSGATPGTNLNWTGTGYVTVDAGASATMNVMLSGPGGVVKTGLGLLTLGNTNNFAGNLTVAAGTLAFSADTHLGPIPAAFNQTAVTMNDSATLRLNLGITTLHANRGLTIAANTANLDALAGQILFIPNVVDGASATIVKTGAGEVGFYGASNKFAKLIIDQGNLRIGQSTFPGYDESYGAVPAVPTPDAITIRNGATNRVVGLSAVTIHTNRGITLGPGGGVFRNDVSPVSLTINSPITGPGSLRKEGGQALILNGNNTYLGSTTINAGGTTTMNGANNAPGPLLVNAGTVTINHANTFASVTMQNGRINANTNFCLGSGPVSLTPTGTVTVLFVNATALSPTNVMLNNDLTLGPTTGGIDIAANLGRELVLNGKVSGPANWIKNNSGSAGFVVLGNAANDFTGRATVFAGAVIATADNALGSTAGATLVTNVGTLGFRGGVTYTAMEPVVISGRGFTNLAGPVGVIAGLGGNNSFAGPVTLAGNSSVGASNGTTLTLSGAVGETGGSFVLSKLVPGTVVLTAPNTYSGGTLVSNGTLVVANTSGSATGPGAVTIYPPGVLAGPGSVAGAITVNGSISPGASPGTLNSGSETWNGGGSYIWELNDTTGAQGIDPGWDFLNISGALTINATSGNKFNIDVTSLTLANTAGDAANFNGAIDYLWTIATASGGITGFDPAAFNIIVSNFSNPTPGGAFRMESSGNEIRLRYFHPAMVTVAPMNPSAMCGDIITFTATASGSTPLSYQWRKNGIDLGGETGTTLSLGAVSAASAGSYDVVVTNIYSAITSAPTVLTIIDTIPPVITCPAGITLKTTNTAGEIISYPAPVASDNCGPPVVVCVPASGSNFPIGANNVTCIATDAAGNTNACMFSVTIYLQGSSSNFVNTVIPDNDANGLASTMTVASPIGVLTDVNVTLLITNGWNGDLYCYLNHDSGFSVLLNRVGRRAFDPIGYGDPGFDITLDDSATNGDIHTNRYTLFGDHVTPIGGPLTGSWAPDARATSPTNVLDTDARSEFLSSFNGLNPNGGWTLFIADVEGGDQSTLVSWCIEFCGFLPIPASITTQPGNQTVECSSNLTLTVTTAGTAPFTNQWYYPNGNPIPGATALSATLSNLHPVDAGAYTFVVCNMANCATSAPIVVNVVDTIAPAITACATNFSMCPAPVPDFTGQVVASDACSAVTITQFPAPGSMLPSGAHVLTFTASDDTGNTNACTAVLAVYDVATITTQPQNQTTPMGNGAVFSVTATSPATITYQWQTNGVDVSGAVGAGLAISNLPYAMNGTLVRVVVSNCAGSVTSVAAVLTVTPITGIAFDFNGPGQFTNQPYALAMNNFMNSAVPPLFFERSTGGVGVATGGGSVDLVAGGGDYAATLLPVTYDFSLPGRTLIASAMIRLKAPTAAGRALQMAFVTTTNVNNAWQHVQSNNGQGFMSVILQCATTASLSYQLQHQHKVIAGTGNVNPTPVHSVSNVLATNNWYKLVGKFVNVKGAAGSVTASNFTIEASLQNMGADGQTPGAITHTWPVQTGTNIDLVGATRLMLSMRVGAGETCGADYFDNVYVHTAAGAPVFVAAPESQVVLPGRQARFRALVDGDGPYSYQWQKSDGIGFTNIPGATAWNLLTTPLLLSDGGAQYRVVVTGASGVTTSGAGTVTVFPDPLAVVSAGSIDGSSVGVRFNQPVDPVSAANPANYLINGVPAVAAQVYVSPTDLRNVVQEGTRVVLTPASMFMGPFTVVVSGVQDLSGGSIGLGNTAGGTVAGLTGEDINPYFTSPSGQQQSFADGQFEVSGGGADIWDRADSFRYVYKRVSGDFDVKARIPHVDLMRGPTKAGFDARTSLDPFSPQVLAAVNPQLPGRNFTEGTFEATYNVLAAGWGAGTVVSYPNVWLRFRRVGNTFIRYSSANGTTWNMDGQLSPNPALPSEVYLGLAVCAVANNNLATAWFENYGDFAGYAGATNIVITQEPINVTTGAPNAALLTVVAALPGGPALELAYTWQRENGAGGWTNMPTGGTTTAGAASTNVLNTGALFGSDNGAQYRVIVSAPGALSATSGVAVVTVTDVALPVIAAGFVPTNSVRNIVLIYSEPMGAGALNAANYAVTNGPGAVFTVGAAVFLNGDPRVVQLTVMSDLAPGPYGVRVTGPMDLNGNAIAANTLALVFQMGFGTGQPFVVELFGGLAAPTTQSITDLVNNLKFAGGDGRYSFPELINYSNVFGINPGIAAFPNTLDNYGIRMYSWFVPPTSGDYKFYLRGDDFVQFWMNTNPASSTLPPDGVIPSSTVSPPVAFNSPVAEQAYLAFDNSTNSKYLNSTAANAGAVVVPAMGSSVVTGVRLTTANDVPDRDPLTFTLEGTTGNPATGPWTLIASGNTGLQPVTTRFTVGPTISFPNATAYTSYRILFPNVRGPTITIMQVAEIELLDAGGVDVTGRGALPRINIPANNPNYTAANSITNTLVGGQRYFVELRFKEGGGGDGGTVAIRTDNTVPAATEVAPGTLFQFPAPHAPATPVQIELYTGLVQANVLGNGRIEDLIVATNLPQVIAGIPNVTGFGKHFGFNTNLANSGIDNYLGRMYALFIAPSNGLYKFYIRSDDSSQLLMNTNPNPALSREPGGMTSLGIVERFINVNYWLVAENVSLNAGQRYYMEGRWREGGGGDGMVVTYRSQGDATTPNTAETIPASQLEMATNQLRYGPVTVAGIAPASPVANVGETVTFQAVGIGGTPPYGFFWLKNGVQIFANNPIYTNPPVTLADNNAIFTLVVTNPWSRAEATALLTVNTDGNPPTLVSAVGSQYQEYVTVTYDGPVDPTSAACLANYTINNGVRVLSVAYDSGRRNRVSLRTSPQTPGAPYIVTVNGVKDLSGNLIAANSTINFTAWTLGGCGFYVELFTNITGGAVDNLVKDYKYINNLPDESYYTNLAGIGRLGADTGRNNYGGRLSAFVIPPSNGLYRFYVRGDDGTQLFMNTNGPDTRGRVLIARNDNANSATNLTTVPQLSPYQTGVGLGILGASISPIISLTNGTAYYFEALLKEGGGQDHLEIVFRPVNPGTLADVPPLQPVNAAAADLSPLFAGFFAAPGNPDAVQLVNILQSPPSDLFLIEYDPVSLALVATITPPSAALATCYQWQRETAVGSGAFTNIPGAVFRSLPTFLAVMAEDGLKYRLQAMLPVPRVYTTTLHVMADASAPYIVSASSLGGTNIDLCYNQPVDVLSAIDGFNYSINGGAIAVVPGGVVRADGRTVSLPIDLPLGGAGTPFTIDASGVYDLAFTIAGGGSTNGVVQGYIPQDVGGPPGAGSSFSCVPGEIDVIAGGADIWGTADQGHLTLRPICGNFDIWARVQRLDRAVADNDGITKAGLMVRESFLPGSRKLHVLVEPPAVVGGRDLYEAGRRRAVDGDTIAWDGGNGNTINQGFARAGIPNAWIRIKRTGNIFEAYRSIDGVNWLLATTNNVNLSNVVYVGLAATAHIPSPSAATTYAEFRNIHIPAPPTITAGPTPTDQTVAVYTPVTWSVTAVNPPNAGPLTYQWQRNGQNIPGATASSYTIASAQATDAGRYTIVVGNDGGCTNTSVTLNVFNAAPLVAGDMHMATQNVAQVVAVADLLSNDPGDPEGIPLTLLGVSGYQPLNLNASFEDGLVPAGTSLFGTPLADPGAHVGDDGTGTNKCIHLTDGTVGGAFGAYLIPDMAGGRLVNALHVRWKNRIGGAINNALNLNRPGADGMSFSWGADVPAAPANNPVPNYEDGSGTGLSVCFDTWDNGLFEAPSIEMRWGGVVVARDYINADQGLAKDFLRKDRFVDASLTVTPQGQATLVYDSMTLVATLPGYAGIANGRFLFAGRTGGAFDNHWIDDLSLLALTRDTTRDVLPPAIGGAISGSGGGGYITSVGGVGNSGVLHLTDPANSQHGALVLDELLPGRSTRNFNASFVLQIGSGSADGADGFSFNLANDLVTPAPYAGYEDGAGNGLSICVDNYSGGTTPAGPQIRLKYAGVFIAHQQIPKWNSPNYVPITINLDPDGTVDVTCGGTNIFVNVATPYVPIAGARFGLHARTGGLNQRHWIDNLSINATATDASAANYFADFNTSPYGTVTLSGGQVTYTPPAGLCGPDTWYYVASDGQAGGYAVGQVDVQIKEAVPTAPVIVTCPTNRTLVLSGVAGECQAALPDLTGQLVAIDNCCCTTNSQNPAAGTLTNIGVHAVEVIVTDTMGLSSTCTVLVTVSDVTPPMIFCSTNVIAECTGPAGANVSFIVTATDNCNLAQSVNCVPPSGSFFLNGTTPVNCTADDGNGNMAGCGFTVSVVDRTAPVVVCPANILQLLGAGQCDAVVTYADPTYADCDNAAVIVCTPPSGSVFPAGTNTVNCTVTDASLNVGVCSFTISVIETVKPAILCPPDLVVECGDPTTPPATGVATATDNCDTNPAVSYFDHGTTEIYPGGLGGWVLSAVGDPPPTSSSTLVNGPPGAPLGTGSLRLAIGSNGDDLAQARHGGYQGTLLSALTELNFRTRVAASSGNGETPYLLLNIDADGNGTPDDVIGFEPEYQSGYTLAVPDQGAVVNGVWQSWNAMVGGWWSINHSGVMSEGAGVQPLSVYIAAYPNARLVNASSGAGGVRLIAGSGLGTWEDFDGNVDRFTIGVNGASTMYDFDVTPGDPNPLIVRTWTAQDDSGNQISCSQVINVVDTTAPALTCPASFSVECSEPGGATVAYVVTAVDVCDPNASLVCTPPTGSFFPLGPTTVNCVTTDNVGNSTNCSFVVTVVDTTPPVITCSTNRVVECASGASAPATFVVTATDVCDTNLTVVCLPPSGSAFLMGSTTVNCSVTDMSTNTSMCSFTVTVVDTTPPLINACAPAGSVPANANCMGVTPDLTGLVDASDCNTFAVTQNPTAGSLIPLGPNTVTLTVTDTNGNASGCMVIITVIDTTPPVVTCPANITVECDTPAGTVVTFTASATDNCTASPAIACAPASGSTFPPGTTTVTCWANDTAGNSNSCSFVVTVRDTTPPAFCNNPPLVQVDGGTNDNFVGSEPASPSPDLRDRLEVQLGLNLRNFDQGASDEWFAHSYNNLPDDISAATLRIRIRGVVGIPQNDTIELLFVTPGGGVLPANWSRRIGTGGFDAVPGLLPTPWTQTSVREFVIDLSRLTNANNTVTDLIPTLRAQRYLDLVVQDDSQIDYAVLEIQTCACRSDISVPTDPQSCGAIVSFATPAFLDNCDTSVAIVCSPASGTLFQIGTTTVFCSATDDSGNVGRCSFDVTVTEPAPGLTITRSGPDVVLRWPITCATYHLQQTLSLNPVISWSNVVAPISIVSGQYQVTLPATGFQRYFRLVTP